MRNLILATLAAGAMLATAPAAEALTTTVTFNMLDGATSVANGNFSFDASKTGLLTYGDLDSFSYTLPGGTYDLAFTQSGGFSQYYYFGYNATTEMFQTTTIGGFPQILSAIKSSFDSGYFARYDAVDVLKNYGPDSGEVFYTLLETSSVTSGAPEPAVWLLMIVGFGASGCALRRRLPARTTIRFA